MPRPNWFCRISVICSLSISLPLNDIAIGAVAAVSGVRHNHDSVRGKFGHPEAPRFHVEPYLALGERLALIVGRALQGSSLLWEP